MKNEYDLPEILASILLSDDDDISDLTIDDFYDFMGIPKNDPDSGLYYRNDYSAGILTTQAAVLYSNAR